MDAHELVDILESLSRSTPYKQCADSAAMLRKQVEAIKLLREALVVIQSKAGGTSTMVYRVAEKALKDTEEFK